MSEITVLDGLKFTVGGENSDEVEYAPFVSDRHVGYRVTMLSTDRCGSST